MECFVSITLCQNFGEYKCTFCSVAADIIKGVTLSLNFIVVERHTDGRRKQQSAYDTEKSKSKHHLCGCNVQEKLNEK